jgi:hypothetical protein
VIIYKDKNGYLTQIGGYEQYLTFVADSNTGDMPQTKNGVSFSFKGTIRKKPVHYIREIVTSEPSVNPGPVGDPVTIRINGQVVALVQPGGTYSINSEFTLEFQLQA